jgi:TonB family protein
VDNITRAEQSVASIENTNQNTGAKVAREKTPPSSFLRWLSGWKRAFLQERRDVVLITLIIGLSIFLGWTLGTTERSSVHRNSIASVGPVLSNPTAGTSVDLTTVVQAVDQSAGSDKATIDASEVKVEDKQNQAKRENHGTQKKSGHSSASQPVTSDVSSSDVVIFENGRQVFPASLQQSEGIGGVAASNDPDGTTSESDDNKNQLSVSEDAAQERLLKRVEPDYPESAREARLQGAVILNINVASDGTVHGFSRISGDPQLTLLAAKAVRQWKFAPLLRDGAPVSFKTRVTLNFALP